MGGAPGKRWMAPSRPPPVTGRVRSGGGLPKGTTAEKSAVFFSVVPSGLPLRLKVSATGGFLKYSSECSVIYEDARQVAIA